MNATARAIKLVIRRWQFLDHCKESIRLALDAAPMDAGERARVERKLRGNRNGR